MALPAEEFLRRFLLHVVPTGFQRIRHFGLLANRRRAQALARCRALLREPAPPAPAPRETALELLRRLSGVHLERCPVCQDGTLRVVARLARGATPPETRDTS